MVGANAKAEIVTMMDKRTAMENKMDAIIACLTNLDNPGLQDNLVDAASLSRIHSWGLKVLCRLVANRLTLLKWIVDVEVARPSPKTTPMDIAPITGNTSTKGPCPMGKDASKSGLPIAVFDDVFEGSPAAMDGVLLGDQLVKFGNVDGGNDLLMQLAREGQVNEG